MTQKQIKNEISPCSAGQQIQQEFFVVVCGEALVCNPSNKIVQQFFKPADKFHSSEHLDASPMDMKTAIPSLGSLVEESPFQHFNFWC